MEFVVDYDSDGPGGGGGVTEEDNRGSVGVLEDNHTVERKRERRGGVNSNTKKKKSRWGTATSAFLAPIAYDRVDAEDETEDDNDDDSRGVRVGVGNRPSLMHVLPAPVHEIHDKGANVSVCAQERVDRVGVVGSVEQQYIYRSINAAPEVDGGDMSSYMNTSGRIEDESAVTRQKRNEKSWNSAAARIPSGVHMKEISGAALRSQGVSSSIADLSGMRAALGAEYENKLRSEAGRVGTVSKLAKRKNQLSSLFVAAKSEELDLIEKQALGMKTKAETQKKYGW